MGWASVILATSEGASIVIFGQHVLQRANDTGDDSKLKILDCVLKSEKETEALIAAIPRMRREYASKSRKRLNRKALRR